MAFGLDLTNVDRYIASYGAYLVRQAKIRLKSKKATGSLYNSLGYQLDKSLREDRHIIELKMLSEKYGKFVEQGVSGTKGKRTYINIKGKRVVSKFKRKKQPPPQSIFKWIKAKRIKGRDKKTGRFITDKATAFLIGRGIKRKGTPGLSFYSQPMSATLKYFKKNLEKNFKADVVKNLTNIGL